MSGEQEVAIRDVPQEERGTLDAVLVESFTGVYLRHARRTLNEVPYVRAAFSGEKPVGLSMLEILKEGPGYVYYIAVSTTSRRKGLGTKLLLDALRLFSSLEVKEVYASVGEENMESNALFSGQGFRRTNYSEVSRKFGIFKAIAMYREMLVVPGEHLLVRDNATLPEGDPQTTPRV